MIEFSIIIATLDRLHDLEEVIISLLNQDVITDSYEIIIADGGTKNMDYLEEKFQKYTFVHFIHCNAKGASIQRNIGVKHSKGKYLAFIDDDAIAPANWLSTYKAHFYLDNWGVLAGRIDPKWQENAKNFHKKSDFIKNLYSMFDMGTKVKKTTYGFSCNYLIKRTAFQQVGGFDLSLGRIDNNRVLYREDIEICEQIAKQYTNYYIPEAYVLHKVSAHRLQWKWLIRTAYARGLTKGLIRKKPQPYRKLQLSFYDYLLLIPYAFGYANGNIKTYFNQL